MYYLGIDLGTTGCKCILFDEYGNPLSEYYKEYSLIIHENFIEQDARLWWSMVKEAVNFVVKDSCVKAKDIKALSISSQGIAFVPVDKTGEPLCNVISWLDTRAAEEIKGFNELDTFRKTGKRLRSSYTLPKILWLKKNKPDIYDKTYKFLMGLDYLNFRFTGRAVTDHSMASGTMLYDITTQKWDKSVDVDISKLPEIQYIGTPIGTVLPEVVKEVGLSSETVVVLGGQDQKCAAIGAGIDKGICTVSLGTSTAVTMLGNTPLIDEQMRIPCFVIDKYHWSLEAVISTSGIALKWVKNTFFKDKTYDELDALAEQSPIGSNGVIFQPHFSGASAPWWQPDASGSISGLHLHTTEGDIVRSVFEGICYQIRMNVDIIEELAGEIRQIRVFGGGAKSDVWCSIMADITGKEVCTLSTCETAILGAAMLASMGKIDNAANIKKIFKPQNFKEYEVLYNELKSRSINH